MNRTLVVGLALALVVAACASPQDSTSGGSDVAVPSTATIPDTLVSPVDIAQADLASVLGSAEGIAVVLAEDVMWPDGSLGCPQPGMAYTQALVDGYRIELTDGSNTYVYHGAVGRDPFLCNNEGETGSAGSDGASPTTTVVPPDEGEGTSVVSTDAGTYDGALADLVKVAAADLAELQQVALGDIEVISAEATIWPDSSLGCPQPDMAYLQVMTDGARIVLSIDGGIFTYHSGGTRPPFLCVPTKPSADGTTGLTLPGIGLDE